MVLIVGRFPKYIIVFRGSLHQYDQKLTGLGRAPGGQCQTWKRAVERETKNLGKSLRELKLLARNRIRWRAGIVDALCPIEN